MIMTPLMKITKNVCLCKCKFKERKSTLHRNELVYGSQFFGQRQCCYLILFCASKTMQYLYQCHNASMGIVQTKQLEKNNYVF